MLGFAACCLRFDPDARKLAIIPLRSSGGESGNLVIALARRCQATSPDAPTKIRELRGSVVMQERLRLTVLASCAPVASPCLPGQNTRAVIFNAAPFAVSRCRVTLGKVGPRRLPRPPRADGPVHRDITASCVQSGGCIVTPIAPASPPVAPPPVALLSVRQLAGILHANSAAPLC